jgi:hypothetical protein
VAECFGFDTQRATELVRRHRGSERNAEPFRQKVATFSMNSTVTSVLQYCRRKAWVAIVEQDFAPQSVEECIRAVEVRIIDAASDLSAFLLGPTNNGLLEVNRDRTRGRRE